MDKSVFVDGIKSLVYVGLLFVVVLSLAVAGLWGFIHIHAWMESNREIWVPVLIGVGWLFGSYLRFLDYRKKRKEGKR